jgi:hypothetical protein
MTSKAKPPMPAANKRKEKGDKTKKNSDLSSPYHLGSSEKQQRASLQ